MIRNVERWKYYCLITLYIVLCVVMMLSGPIIHEYFELTNPKYTQYSYALICIYLNVMISVFLWQEERITLHWGYTIAFFIYVLILVQIIAFLIQWIEIIPFVCLMFSTIIFVYHFEVLIFYLCHRERSFSDPSYGKVPFIHLGCCVFPVVETDLNCLD